MAEAAAYLVENVLPEQPILQWVLSFPYPGRFHRFSAPARGVGTNTASFRCLDIGGRQGTHVASELNESAFDMMTDFHSLSKWP